MSRRFIGAGLLMAFLLSFAWLSSTPALAQKKKKADKVKADAIDSGKFAPGEISGLLKTTPGSDRMFNLESEQDKLVPTGKGNGKGNGGGNPGGPPRPAKAPNMNKLHQSQQKMQQAMHHGQQAQARLASAKTPPEQKKAQNELTKAQNELTKAQGDYQTAVAQVLAQSNAQSNYTILAAIRKNKLGTPAGYKIDRVKSLVEFQASETVKVRTMILPEEFDEKGKPKKYTKEELATLKGKDKNLLGYESSLEKLETGQKLRVVLAAVAKKPVAKDPDKDAEDMTDKKMQVKTIFILEEAKSQPAPPKAKKK